MYDTLKCTLQTLHLPWPNIFHILLALEVNYIYSSGNIQDKLEREQNQVENANEKMDNLERLKETSQEAGEFFSVSCTVKGCSIALNYLHTSPAI